MGLRGDRRMFRPPLVVADAAQEEASPLRLLNLHREARGGTRRVAVVFDADGPAASFIGVTRLVRTTRYQKRSVRAMPPRAVRVGL